MVRMVCLANSWRPGGRCVAGIDLETGEWVRPVPKGGSAIPEGATHFGKHDLAPLDVVEVELAPPTLTTKYQRENRVITSKTWTYIETLTPADVMKYCSKGWTMLHGHSKVVEPPVLEALQPSGWTSLELRRLKSISFSPDGKKENRWKADFSIGGLIGTDYSLSLTDPLLTKRLNDGEEVSGECLITISLTEPIALPQFGLPELCYKLAAAVMFL